MRSSDKGYVALEEICRYNRRRNHHACKCRETQKPAEITPYIARVDECRHGSPLPRAVLPGGIFFPYHAHSPSADINPARVMLGLSPVIAIKPTISVPPKSTVRYFETLANIRRPSRTRIVKLYPLATTMCVRAVTFKSGLSGQPAAYFCPSK